MSAPVIIKHARGSLSLRKLTVQQMIDLQEQDWQVRRDRLVELLDQAGAPAELRVERLEDLAKYRDHDGNLCRSAFSARGAQRIIVAAMEAAGEQTIKFDDLELDPSDSLARTALALLGIDFDRLIEESAAARKAQEAGDIDPDDDPDPTERTPAETGTASQRS